MTESRAATVARRFGAAVADYDAAAGLQRAAAGGLAEALDRSMPRPPSRALEFGCGTGLAGAAMLARWPGMELLATDLSEAMTRAALQRYRDLSSSPVSIQAVVMDAERPAVSGPFDLVFGSMAAQWFLDPPAALAGLASLRAARGWLACAVLAPGSLPEWRAALAEEGGAWSGLTPPGPEPYRAALAGRGVLAMETHVTVVEHGNGLAFLRGLRTLGADLPHQDHGGHPLGLLRRAARRLDATNGRVTWRVLSIILGP